MIYQTQKTTKIYIKIRQKMFLSMNYFNSTEATQLFNCQTEDNNIEDCLSCKIDIFSEIINHKQAVSIMVNKANKKIVS